MVETANAEHIAISIHVLREEGDPLGGTAPVKNYVFLSTSSARRATLVCQDGGFTRCDFYPRPPRGGRLFLSQLRCVV